MTTSRAKPLVSSTSRNIGSAALADKKRLSTIPASPAVKADVEEAEENKENGTRPNKQTAVRPALGSRKSTRSVLIEQQIREFELVNSMLQAAMTADGADDQEQQSVNEEAAATMAKLKSDLAKVREFERSNGRLPTSTELEEVQSVSADHEAVSVSEGLLGRSGDAGGAALELENELAQSKAQIDALQSELVDLKTKLQEFSRSAEEESQRVAHATDAIRAEHASKVEELTSLHDTKIRELEDAHSNKLQGVTTDQRSEAAAVREQLSAEMESKMAALETEHKAQLSQLQESLDLAEAETAKKHNEITQQSEEHAKIDDEVSRQAQVIQSLKKQVLESQQATKEENTTQTVLISQLRDEIELVKKQGAEATAGATANLAAAERANAENVATIEKELSTVRDSLKQAENLHEGKLQEVLKKSESDLSAASAELESWKTSHESRLQDLEAELRAGSEEAKSKQGAHKEALSTLQSQVDSLKVALGEATTNQEMLIKDHESQSNSAKEEMALLKSSHDADLTRLRSTSQSTHAEELAALIVGHADQIQKLEQQLHSSRKEARSLKETHASRTKQLEEQVKASLADLEVLEAGHIEQLNRTKSEAAEAQRAVEDAEKTHAHRVQQLEQQLQATETDLSVVKSDHAKEVDDLERQRLLDQEVALGALRETHSNSIKDLESELKAVQGALDSAKAGHAEQLKALEKDTAARHAEAIESLKTSHAKLLEDVQGKTKADQEQALEELRTSLAEEKRQLEAQSKSLRGDLEGTRFQIQSLKGILQSVEAENKEQEQEHAETLEKMEESLSMSVRKLAEQSTRVMDLQGQHDQALAHAKQTLETSSQQELQSLRTDHETALAGLRSSLEEEHRLSVDKFREEHTRSLAANQATNRSQHDELQRTMKEENDKQLDEVMKTLESQWKSQVDQLEQSNAAASARLAKASEDHAEALQSITSEHETTLTKLQAALETAQESSKSADDTSELDEVKQQLAQALQQAQTLEVIHKTAMTAAMEERDSTVASVRQEHVAEYEVLGSKFVAAQKTLDELQAKHELAIRETEAQYDAKLEKVLTELNETKEVAGKGTDSMKGETANPSLEDAKKTISSLQAQLDGALQELETQRGLSDSAQKEADQLRQAQKESEVIALPSPKPRRKSRSPKRKSTNALSAGGSKTGLESSRWAAVESTEAGEPATGLRGGSIDEDADTAADPETPSETQGQGSPSKSKRNVAGQLAGIQEQIRQLDDLSEDFLEEHQKMARTLSRVDDRTASTIEVTQDDDVD